MSPQSLIRLRHHTLGLTGLVCLLYAVLALATGRPDPIPFWIPAAFGAASGVLITSGFILARPESVAAADDELYRALNARALTFGYVVALASQVAASVLAGMDLLEWPTAVAASSTLTGAGYLLPLVWMTGWRA